MILSEGLADYGKHFCHRMNFVKGPPSLADQVMVDAVNLTATYIADTDRDPV